MMLSHCHVSALSAYAIEEVLKMVKEDTSEWAGPFSEEYSR